MKCSLAHWFPTRLPVLATMTDTWQFSAWETVTMFVISRANIGNRCTFLTALRPFRAPPFPCRDEAIRLPAYPVFPAQLAGIISPKELS